MLFLLFLTSGFRGFSEGRLRGFRGRVSSKRVVSYQKDNRDSSSTHTTESTTSDSESCSSSDSSPDSTVRISKAVLEATEDFCCSTWGLLMFSVVAEQRLVVRGKRRRLDRNYTITCSRAKLQMIMSESNKLGRLRQVVCYERFTPSLAMDARNQCNMVGRPLGCACSTPRVVRQKRDNTSSGCVLSPVGEPVSRMFSGAFICTYPGIRTCLCPIARR